MGNAKICLTKARLAEDIELNIGIEKAKSVQIVEDFIELVKEFLERDGKVMLSGFGSYEVKEKPQRRGRNPQTGSSMMLRPRKVVKFKPSQILRRSINGEEPGTED